MANYADKMTARQLGLLEKQITKQYTVAAKELDAKSKAYFKQFKVRKKEQEDRYKAGEITKQQYQEWCVTQMARGERWEALRDQMSARIVQANNIVAGYVNDKTPSIYSLNRNYTAYTIEKDCPGLSFTLVNERTVKELMEGHNHTEFRVLDPNPIRDYAWNTKKIQNALTQGILQGDSIEHLSNRYMDVMQNNRAAAIRNARTAVTSAQNAGRQNAYVSAVMMGIEIEKEWIATLDGRTRDSHQKLDGERVPYDQKFSNKLMYPGDPSGAGSEVYNCRCTMRAILPGINDEHDVERAYKVQNEADGTWHREYESGKAKTARGVTYRGQDMTVSFDDWMNGKSWDSEPLWKAKDELSAFQHDLALANKAVNDFKLSKYAGIWRGRTVTEEDYQDLQDSVPKKLKYYQDEKAKAHAAGDDLKENYYEGMIQLLDKFETQGEIYLDLKFNQSAIQAEVDAKLLDIRKLGGYDPWEDPYSEERKNAALWAKDPSEADKVLRGVCSDVWLNASKAERHAIYNYTTTYYPYNEPLRGIEYGTSIFKGVGNTSLNRGGQGENINKMTDIINKSSYNEDIWLQRGCRYSGMDRFFNCSDDLLRYGSQSELENELVGNTVTEYAFMSCGTAKGKGFTNVNVILNVYAPAGTNMMYAEPYSYYGECEKSGNWDGKKQQSTFGQESEIILQQGTQFRVTKVERTPHMLYFDLEVIGRKGEQRWTK